MGCWCSTQTIEPLLILMADSLNEIQYQQSHDNTVTIICFYFLVAAKVVWCGEKEIEKEKEKEKKMVLYTSV